MSAFERTLNWLLVPYRINELAPANRIPASADFVPRSASCVRRETKAEAANAIKRDQSALTVGYGSVYCKVDSSWNQYWPGSDD